jgi:SAM-dependent methyltransferase
LESIRKLAPALKGKMMDFGCGQKPYASLFEVDDYIGVDFENPGHPHVNESIDVFYDGKSLPFPDSYFDSIFCSEVFEHIFNLPDILIEMNRVLKTGGKMLITCPFSFCEHEVPNDFARYTSFALQHLLKEKGFEIEVQIKAGSSVETINQLRLMYLHQHIYPRIKKIPLVRSCFRLLVYSFLNGYSLIMRRILPVGSDLYMSNVILCKKTK